jgi:hypothetical protein
MQRFFVVSVAAGLFLSEVSASAQCAMCRAVLATVEAQRLAGALRSGIVVLLIAPVAAVGMVALAAARSRRRTTIAQHEEEPAGASASEHRQ